jgi:hypothetical protein
MGFTARFGLGYRKRLNNKRINFINYKLYKLNTLTIPHAATAPTVLAIISSNS